MNERTGEKKGFFDKLLSGGEKLNAATFLGKVAFAGVALQIGQPEIALIAGGLAAIDLVQGGILRVINKRRSNKLSAAT